MPGDGIRYYSLLYVCVFLGGYHLLNWQIRRAGGSEQDASDFVMYGVISVLGGARMGHVFFYDFDKFLEDPLWLFRIWEGGLASHGGTIGLIIGMWIFTKLRRQSFLEGSDRFAFSAALGATLIRFGNFFNSEIVGRFTDQTWGVRFVLHDGKDAPCHIQDEVLPSCLRHPSQLYEAALGLFVMACLWATDRAFGKEKRPRGLLISMFFALYFTGRFIVEYWKDFQEWALCVGDVCPDSIVKGIKLMHSLPQSALINEGQLLSIIPALAGFVGVALSIKKKIPAHWNVPGAPKKPADKSDKGDPDVDDVMLDKR
jgi:phosphatidylglycerol---prolipoprotein diacylglyceryl transferase